MIQKDHFREMQYGLLNFCNFLFSLSIIKERITIAQNLFSNPPVIFIDESLSSIDEEIEKDIMKSLLQDFGDKTFVFISHRKSS